MKKYFVLMISLLLFLGISTAAAAQPKSSWEKSFQKEFSGLGYSIQNSWDSEMENQTEINSEADNKASVKQIGSGNSALIVQNGNLNSASITQIGESNRAVIKQFSDRDNAVIKQRGSNNKAVIIQK